MNPLEDATTSSYLFSSVKNDEEDWEEIKAAAWF